MIRLPASPTIGIGKGSLTVRQLKFIKLWILNPEEPIISLVRKISPNITDGSASTWGSRVLKKAGVEMEDLLIRAGLDITTDINNIKKLNNAKNEQVRLINDPITGEIKEYRTETPDNQARLKALELSLKLKGKLSNGDQAPQQVNNTQINVVDIKGAANIGEKIRNFTSQLSDANR